MKRTDRRRRQRGTQIVEMAIALPLLALIVFMIIEGSDFIRVHQILNNAAREGARFSILNEFQYETGAIQQIVINYAANDGITLTTSNVTVNQSASIPTGGPVGFSGSQITVTYPYTLKYLPGIPGFNLSSTVNLTAQAEFCNFY